MPSYVCVVGCAVACVCVNMCLYTGVFTASEVSSEGAVNLFLPFHKLDNGADAW